MTELSPSMKKFIEELETEIAHIEEAIKESEYQIQVLRAINRQKTQDLRKLRLMLSTQK